MHCWRCAVCQWSFTSAGPIVVPVACRCGAIDHDGETVTILDDAPGAAAKPTRPGILRAVVRYSRAYLTWSAAGQPVRSDDEVDRIFTTHCQPCPFFDASTCNHPACGCQIRTSAGESVSLVGRWVSPRLANKLRWSTERCPDGRWS
jgi:hypothetical protein